MRRISGNMSLELCGSSRRLCRPHMVAHQPSERDYARPALTPVTTKTPSTLATSDTTLFSSPPWGTNPSNYGHSRTFWVKLSSTTVANQRDGHSRSLPTLLSLMLLTGTQLSSVTTCENGNTTFTSLGTPRTPPGPNRLLEPAFLVVAQLHQTLSH